MSNPITISHVETEAKYTDLATYSEETDGCDYREQAKRAAAAMSGPGLVITVCEVTGAHDCTEIARYQHGEELIPGEEMVNVRVATRAGDAS